MKPSKIKSIKAKRTRLLPNGFRAITWFGKIYCKYQSDVELINETSEINSILKCHELIHVKQAESCSDSWFWFYVKYILFYIKNLPLIFINKYAPYYFIPFELEAYAYESFYYYPSFRCVNWKLFDKLTLKKKIKFAKEFKNENYLTFSQFTNKTIIPYIKEKEG